ncbi:hypothetical protein [Flavobacterium sp. N502536]|uniref:hypothetical protein n=1 Tax=Flavobacterium sp. N502536 TaxID=2986837 RepID=UPI0029CAB5F0|nr:hypothetical protein [Flavobacterium sp. N502536]
MKTNPSIFQLKVFLIAMFLFQFQTGFSQEKKGSELYQTIMSRDSLLFNVGFNTCDISQFENLYTDDFEFYHDRDGPSDKATFLVNLKKVCAVLLKRTKQEGILFRAAPKFIRFIIKAYCMVRSKWEFTNFMKNQ